MTALMMCMHCGQPVQGEAHVVNDGIVHAHCLKEYRLRQAGLIFKCPKCRTTGRMADPSGRTEKKDVPLEHGATPDCAWDGCMGCFYCREKMRRVEVPVQVSCDLCGGVGHLKSEPKPVTAVVGWKATS